MPIRFHRQMLRETGSEDEYFTIVVVPDAAAEQAADKAWQAAIDAEEKLWAAGDMQVPFDEHWGAVAEERLSKYNDVSAGGFVQTEPAAFIGSLLKFLAGGDGAKFAHSSDICPSDGGPDIEMWKEPSPPAMARIWARVSREGRPSLTCGVTVSEFIRSLADVVQEYPEAAIKAFLGNM